MTSGRHILAYSLLVLALPASAGTVQLPSQAGGSYAVEVTSFASSLFRNIVRQQYDFSCGAAAVATLLSYHYGRWTSEDEVFSAMFAQGDQEKIRRSGFSMLDMKRYLASRGIASDGFRVTLDQLGQARLPAIALTNERGYLHFVVVKGVTRRYVLVGDPALGMRKLPRAQFEESWNGVLFIIRDDTDIASRHFNLASDWAVKQRAPIANAANRGGVPDFFASIKASQKL